MTNYKASEQYAQTKIQTASGGDLVVMLYQAALNL